MSVSKGAFNKSTKSIQPGDLITGETNFQFTVGYCKRKKTKENLIATTPYKIELLKITVTFPLTQMTRVTYRGINTTYDLSKFNSQTCSQLSKRVNIFSFKKNSSQFERMSVSRGVLNKSTKSIQPSIQVGYLITGETNFQFTVGYCMWKKTREI